MSEWKMDENGRLYRQFGEYSREYAQDMHYSSRYKEEVSKPVTSTEKKPVRRCPFKSIVNSNCVGDKCAFFVGDNCALGKLTTKKPTRNTAGLRCPINKEARPCSEDCAIFNGGCMLSAISDMKGENHESV